MVRDGQARGAQRPGREPEAGHSVTHIPDRSVTAGDWQVGPARDIRLGSRPFGQAHFPTSRSGSHVQENRRQKRADPVQHAPGARYR